jgi:hypothetical protein
MIAGRAGASTMPAQANTSIIKSSVYGESRTVVTGVFSIAEYRTGKESLTKAASDAIGNSVVPSLPKVG